MTSAEPRRPRRVAWSRLARAHSGRTYAYFRRMRTVPGWLLPTDFWALVELDRLQRAAGVRGDGLEIGAYAGRTAILLGFLLQPGERLVVCDPFGSAESLDEDNAHENARYYDGLTREVFEHAYLTFHAELPRMVVGPSTLLPGLVAPGSCRLVHVDGGHSHAVARRDVDMALAFAAPGAVLALDDVSKAHLPGAALAIWETVLSGSLVPVALSDAKLYGADATSAPGYRAGLAAWGQAMGLRVDWHTLAGHRVPRMVPRP